MRVQSFSEMLLEHAINKGKLGGQHKVPSLSNERGFITDILNLQA